MNRYVFILTLCIGTMLFSEENIELKAFGVNILGTLNVDYDSSYRFKRKVNAEYLKENNTFKGIGAELYSSTENINLVAGYKLLFQKYRFNSSGATNYIHNISVGLEWLFLNTTRKNFRIGVFLLANSLINYQYCRNNNGSVIEHKISPVFGVKTVIGRRSGVNMSFSINVPCRMYNISVGKHVSFYEKYRGSMKDRKLHRETFNKSKVVPMNRFKRRIPLKVCLINGQDNYFAEAEAIVEAFKNKVNSSEIYSLAQSSDSGFWKYERSLDLEKDMYKLRSCGIEGVLMVTLRVLDDGYLLCAKIKSTTGRGYLYCNNKEVRNENELPELINTFFFQMENIYISRIIDIN